LCGQWEAVGKDEDDRDLGPAGEKKSKLKGDNRLVCLAERGEPGESVEMGGKSWPGGEKENGEALVGCVLVCEGDNSGEGKETVEPAGSAK
jgi:hypothetical protein